MVVDQTTTLRLYSIPNIDFVIVGYKRFDELASHFDVSINGTSAPPIQKEFYGNEISTVQLDCIRSELTVEVPITPKSEEILEIIALEQM